MPAKKKVEQPTSAFGFTPYEPKASSTCRRSVAGSSSRAKLPPDAPGRFKGHAYVLYSHAKRPVVGDGIMIIGDAAGLAYAQSGEAIRPAIESGIMAAEVAVSASRDYSRARLAGYEERLQTRFGERNSHAPLAGVLSQILRLALARSLMQTQWFARHVVLDRWFLHAGQPTLPAGGAG